MSGKAVLICRPNSHPFPERTLILDQPVKIGRSVARARPASNNAIFDCKVLSRNHALIWYSNGKFYLQDTKSSNGTFVNNHRLSKSGEESPPREVCSGDIVQFGVDVLENTRKVTHGCIVANLKLYLPDGKEAKASLSTSVISSNTVPVEILYELHQHLQEAIQREQLLHNKLTNLQEMLDSIREAADEGWKALIAEDRLLTRVNVLESQLIIYSKNFGEDKIREELKKLQEDMNTYQNSAKKFVKKILDEKLETVQKYQDTKRYLLDTEAQYSLLNKELKLSKTHVQELAHKLSLESTKTEDFTDKIMRIQSRNEELERELEIQKGDAPYVGGKLIVDLRAPGSTVSNILRPAISVSDVASPPILHESSTDDEEQSKKDAEDLYVAQMELLKIFGSNDDQLSMESFEISLPVSNESGEHLNCEPLDQTLSEDDKSYKMSDCSGVEELSDDSSNESLSNTTKEIESYPILQKASLDPGEIIKVNLESNESKIADGMVIENSPLEEFENNLNRLNQNLDEKDILRKQLLETEQATKQSKNEASLLADRVKILTTELESLKQQRHEQAVDNKLRDELHKLTSDYFKAKELVAVYQSQFETLKEDYASLQVDNTKLKDEIQHSMLLVYEGTTIEDLTRKVADLEENLVLVSQKYMACNEEKTNLKRQLKELQLDYHAIIHQPYFNLFFALPCIVLVLAVTIWFYPTLSDLMGTADPPESGPPPENS